MVWIMQFEWCLRWIQAALEGIAGETLVRVIRLADLKFVVRSKASVDAWPWGLGVSSRTTPVS